MGGNGVECLLVGSTPFTCFKSGRSTGKSCGGFGLSGFFGSDGGDFLMGGFGLSSIPEGLESGRGGGSDFLVISSSGLPTGFNLTGISVWLTALGGGGRSVLVFFNLGNSGRFGFASTLSSLTGSGGFLGRSTKFSKH